MKWWYLLQNLISSNEAHKLGVKVWVNSDSKTGYVVRFDIYTGKQYSLVSEESGDQCGTHKSWTWWKTLQGSCTRCIWIISSLLLLSSWICWKIVCMHVELKANHVKPFPNWKKLKKNCLKPTDYQHVLLLSASSKTPSKKILIRSWVSY